MKTMLWVACAVGAIMISAHVAQAQPGSGRGPGGFGGGGSALDLLRDESVRKELEIVEDQVKQMEEAQNSLREKAREMFSGMRDLAPEERREAFEGMRGKMEELRKDMESKADEILLPHQRERLEQLAVQRRMRYQGTSGTLSSSTVVEALGLTEEQQEKMKKVAEEAGVEAREKIAKIQKEAQDKVLKVLTPEQRKKWEDLVGEPFEFSRTQRGGQGGRGPGGQGQRGGGPQRPDA